ncbi:DNA sulfur modification protein DndB [Bacillus luti]|uniref:DNA sulfur modification protein DndB n=1 Tax=Bacillus luti TaxID=2026191 RepID=UPI0012E7FC0A|nr:DNA sulfur modification protein DndB [Bacillus luti]
MGIDFTTLSAKPHYISLNGIKGNQFGHNVISLQCTVDNVLKFLEIDKSVQRERNEIHVAEISKYIQYGLDGNDIYFPPLIFSARGVGEFTENKFNLGMDDKLVILDGQHRIKAFESIQSRLSSREDVFSREKLKKLNSFPLTLQIFTDLTVEQERQLFTDVNTKASKVSNTLLVMYKEGDLVGQLAKEIIFSHPSIATERFEIRSRGTRKKLMTASTLYSVIITLNDGLFYSNGVKGYINNENYRFYKKNTEEFLNQLVKYAPEFAVDRNKYVIFIPQVIIGLAKFIYNIISNTPGISMEYLFEKVIKGFDWSQKNKIFKQLGISFNPSTKKYNFSSGSRASRNIANHLEELFRKVEANV